jgi:hypothetical protein
MIVGLLGFIGSGKGTAGEFLEEQGFHKVSFASGVKDITSEMFDWPRHLLEGDTNESREFRETTDKFWSDNLSKEFTPRLALQLMGTEVGRQVFHTDFWIIKLKRYMEKLQSKHFVVTDVRFANEINFVKKQGGILIEIQRGIKPHWYDLASRANKGSHKEEDFMLTRSGVHESEWRWIGHDMDYIVENNGTLEQLQSKLIKCLTTSYGSSIMSEINEGVRNETIK